MIKKKKSGAKNKKTEKIKQANKQINKQRCVRYANHSYQFKLFYNVCDESMRNENDYDYPPLKDSIDFWNIVKKYVVSFFDVFYPNQVLLEDISIVNFSTKLSSMLGIETIQNKDRLIDVITQMICNATAYHEHVGMSPFKKKTHFFGLFYVRV